ncbi:MAG: geranylgeranylglycerol-phosphate geranylgeranyltransferase [Cyclobacteriaceae bacterium]|nr:geranylgeranylglycerol-phosphate geranylgeranyltransferase [Cyclobacteriaceae bacterium]
MTINPPLFTVRGFLKLTRTGNLVIMTLTQIMTALFLLNKSIEEIFSLRFLVLVVSTGFIAAAGYVINDYYDVKIDYINKPDRVVVGRLMKRRTAMFLHIFLTGCALLMGVWLSWSIFFIHLATSFFLWLYSNTFKRLPFWGNLTVGILTGLCVFVVGIFFDAYPWSLYVYSGFAFFFTLIREIIKDIEDRFGDERFGCRTLPVLWGVRKTKIFILLLMVAFSATLVIVNMPLMSYQKQFYLFIIIVLEIILSVFLYRADKTKHFHQLSVFCKGIIVAGVISMVFNSSMEW